MRVSSSKKTTNARKASCVLLSLSLLASNNAQASLSLTSSPRNFSLASLVVRIDRHAETKGMNEYDKIEAHRHARRAAKNMYDQHYVQNQGADQYDPNQYERPQQLNYRDQNY